jgi:MinD-like ATPase involved in chromosome partitioning or flagellar assembly
MVIGVYGKDGIGKSVFSYIMGDYLTRFGVVSVVNTDFSYPTLPQRIFQDYKSDNSLGHYISSIGRQDIRKYLHQDFGNNALFLAGCTQHDDCYSFNFQFGDDLREQQVRYFIEDCCAWTDDVVIDLSAQYTNPFLIPTMSTANCMLVLLSPDIDGYYWLQSVKGMLEQIRTARPSLRLLYGASKVAEYHDQKAFEEETKIKFSFVLPMSYEIAYQDTVRVLKADGGGRLAQTQQYKNEIEAFCNRLKGAK